MINVTRQATIPTALTAPEIQQYIQDCIRHLGNPGAHPRPEKPASYRTSDLLAAFDRDFYSKCYLTEQRFENSWPMDVEHFIPQVEAPELVYTWTNLFPADGHANRMKPRATPTGGYLKPCDPEDNVETEIIYTLSPYGYDPQFTPLNATNIKAANTCTLLNRVHNGHSEDTKKLTVDLRHAIHKKYIDVLKKIIEWQDAATGSQEKVQAERELREMLSRRSAFTMLCRSIPAVRQRVPADFLD